MQSELIRQACSMGVGDHLTAQARCRPDDTAIVDGVCRYTYENLNFRVNRFANALISMGVLRGDRIAVLSENRAEYIEATYAAAKLGAILSALNWRLSRNELEHCISVVEPTTILVSPRFEDALRETGWQGPTVLIGEEYEDILAHSNDEEPSVTVDPEDGLLILYTSGTTGLPKGALISHRAELARMNLSRIDLGLSEGDGFIAWAPMFHMVSLEHSLHVLGMGGKVFIVDGADPERIAELVGTEPQWWLVLIPGMIDPLIEEMKRKKITAKDVRLVGALADLIPPQTVGEASRLFDAPYWNTFGSTETGMLPAAGTCFEVGQVPTDLSKSHNSFYRWRLVNEEDNDVKRGEAGEIAVRGPTVFSGYWNASEANAEAFRDGWYHMGDMFLEHPDGKLSFVDRSKYLIKSGGENIYPIEIERVLMADPAVIEAVVVRCPDDKWGEVPIAFAVCTAEVSAEHLIQICRRNLSTYKCPREIRFLKSQDDFPRSTSGKVQRQSVEQWLK